MEGVFLMIFTLEFFNSAIVIIFIKIFTKNLIYESFFYKFCYIFPSNFQKN
jgi:hypothetical protein